MHRDRPHYVTLSQRERPEEPHPQKGAASEAFTRANGRHDGNQSAGIQEDKPGSQNIYPIGSSGSAAVLVSVERAGSDTRGMGLFALRWISLSRFTLSSPLA